MAQILPDLVILHGIEKLGIVGILAAGIMFFVRERRSFIAKSGERLETVEKRINEKDHTMMFQVNPSLMGSMFFDRAKSKNKTDPHFGITKNAG